MNDQVFHYQLADEWYDQQMNAYLATDPYAANTALTTTSPHRASRPGGGTGVIPNPVPMGEGIGILVAFAVLYAVLRRRIKYIKK